MRDRIPDWKAWLSSYATDDGKGPPDHILALREATHRACYRRKRLYAPLIRRGILNDKPVRTYSVGPVELPLDVFTSSRWCERRTDLPLPLDRAGWKLCWEFWRGARSYRSIRSHIEKHGMRRPIFADWVVNFDPECGQLEHRCFAYHLGSPGWPFLVLRTGNERLMMAMFEWGWETITTLVTIRDCGHSPEVTALLRHVVDFGVPLGLAKASRGIRRSVSEKGGL